VTSEHHWHHRHLCRRRRGRLGTTTTAGASVTGGVGGTSAANGSDGWDNTGGGGGGGGTGGSRSGGAGGSGIVVVRYSGPQVLTGGVVSTVGGDTVHQFLDTGTSTLDMHSATIDGIISGDGNLVWDKAGTLTLNGANTYTGATTVSSGALRIGPNGSLGTGDVDIAAGSGLDFNSAGTVSLGNTVSGSGSITVSSGTLLVNGTVTADSVTVESGATLGGTGTIAGAVTIATGGTLSPGNSPGTNTVGELTFEADANELWEFTSNILYDQTIVTGDLTFEGVVNLTLMPFGNAAIAETDTFTLFTYGGILTGFDALTTFNVTYGGDAGFWLLQNPVFANTGSAITLTGITYAIPEPSTMILAGLGLAGLTLRRRRR
jgi:fibronectin-binding autotransporter adhesin